MALRRFNDSRTPMKLFTHADGGFRFKCELLGYQALAKIQMFKESCTAGAFNEVDKRAR